MRRNTLLQVLLASTLVVLAGCSSTSQLVTGTPRAPIDPSQVRVYYTAPPGGFEEIAQLQTASGSFTYGEQSKLDDVINNLRVEAAKLGANGVLFVGTENSGGGSSVGVGVGGGSGSYGGYRGGSYTSGGIGVNISPTKKYGHGVAIYVPNPPPETQPQPAQTTPPQGTPPPRPVN